MTISQLAPLLPLKRLATIRSSNVDKVVEDNEIPIRLCNYVDVYYNDQIHPALKFAAGSAKQSEIDRFGLRPGDVLITKDSETPDDIAVPSLVVQGADDLVCGYHLALLRPNPSRLNGTFLFYALKSRSLQAAFSVLAQGITRFGLTLSGIGSVPVPLPDLPTQKAVADFLDRETARINQLIEKKLRMVEVLGAKLAAQLQFAVLGGATLSRNPEGDWLSSLPNNWRLIPMKHLVRIVGGATPSKEREDYWIGPIPWVSPKDMKCDNISETSHFISELALANSPVSIIPEGAVLIVVRGMILAKFVPVCRLGCDATINQDMKALMPRDGSISGHYLQRMLQGFQDVLMSFVDEAAHGTKALRSERFFSLKFPIPPIEQQANLVVEYNKQKRLTDSTIEKTESSIDRLREFRSALITAAVTGGIDVSTWGKQGTTSRGLDQIEEATSA